MRVSYVTLSAVAIAFAIASATSSVTEGVSSDQKFLPGVRSLAADRTGVSTRRLRATKRLRGDYDDEDEERGIGISLIDDFIDKGIAKAMNQALEKADDNIFASPEWKTWASLIQRKKMDDDVVGTLTRRFDPVGVTTVLASDAKNPNTREIATQLQAQRINGWLSHDLDPDGIFKLMKLDKASGDIFDRSQLTAWTDYLAAYNKKNPAKATSMLHGFTNDKSYGKEGFIKLLASADNSVGTVEFKAALMKEWLDGPVHPTNVYRFFQLDKAGDDLLANPLLSTWVAYVDDFNDTYPFAKTTMVETFTKSYGDEKLAAIIQAATKVPKTERFATNLQTAQFKRWMVEKKTPTDVYEKVLKLDSLSSPNADIWRAYFRAYEKENPDKFFSFTS